MEILTEIVPFLLGKKKADLKLTERGGKLAEKNIWTFFGFWSEVHQVMPAVFSLSYRQYYNNNNKNVKKKLSERYFSYQK